MATKQLKTMDDVYEYIEKQIIKLTENYQEYADKPSNIEFFCSGRINFQTPSGNYSARINDSTRRIKKNSIVRDNWQYDTYPS